jgi:hypothetical protein
MGSSGAVWDQRHFTWKTPIRSAGVERSTIETGPEAGADALTATVLTAAPGVRPPDMGTAKTAATTAFVSFTSSLQGIQAFSC